MDADNSLNETTEVNAGIGPKEDCGCTEEINIELNKKILKAFGIPAIDKDSYDYDVHSGNNTTQHNTTHVLDHIPNFTTFHTEHLRNAHGVADKLVEDHEDDVETMIDKLSDLKNVYRNSAYADYLSRITFYKHPKTKNLICPPMSQVLPESFFSLNKLREGRGSSEDTIPLNKLREGLGSSEDTIPHQSPSNDLDPESKLNWWREHVEISEHHANWHAYYPFSHKLDPKLRRGELFAYMHQQMLARYDFERFAVGLPPVVSYGPGIYWDKPLDEGYHINLLNFSARPANMSIPDRIVLHGKQYVMKDMEHHKERILDAIARKELILPIPSDPHDPPDPDEKVLTMDKLGCIVEANGNSVNPGYYGNLHNMGHVVISMMNDPDERYGICKGPMIQDYTSARDPVFYRWHKFIDDLFDEYRIGQNRHQLNDLEIKLQHNTSLNVKKVSIMTMPDDNTKVEKDCLYTKMTKHKITVYWAEGAKYKEAHTEETDVDYQTLEHIPFDYHFTITLTRTPSDSSEKLDDDYIYKLMFRVFMAPQTQVTNLNLRRRYFIELDSFVHEVKWDSSQSGSGSTQTFQITRNSEDSTVAMLPNPTVKHIQAGKSGDPTRFCGCGWPLNLLIPRGTAAGMKADLFVLVTDWEKDAYDKDAEFTGNAAYCGKKGKPYPDRKPMGYPFDRNFKFKKDENDKDLNKLADVFGTIPNSYTIPVTIKFLGE